MLPVMRYEDVVRFQVAMEHLLGMHILQGITYLAEKFQLQSGIHFVVREELGKRAAVNPLHLDAVADFGVAAIIECLAYPRMLQLPPYLELLAQKRFEEIVALQGFLQRLQQPELAVTPDAVQFAVPRRRGVYQFLLLFKLWSILRIDKELRRFCHTMCISDYKFTK